ncbi:MAG: Gfo/Idh/MocA family oxidoreductase [Planctomycetes bacterium]|nr:Gfo/Idh/MocA family oxidoreductase [Planctomycetota bacterium]
MNETTRRLFLQQAGGAAALALMPALAGRTLVLDEPLQVAVVGAGRQGRAILAELQKIEGLAVAAICDSDASRLESGARRAPGARPFADHRELLAESGGLAAVIVATPTHRHREVAEDALAAGRHVYCEAPLAATIADCQAIVAAAARSGRVCQAGLTGRSNPIYKLAHSFLRSGAIREVVALRAQNHRKTSWRTPAADPAREREVNWRLDPEVSIGLAGECGTHQFDVAHWFHGKYPRRVRGTGAIRMHQDGRELADTVQCTLSFEDGVELIYDATLANSFEGQYEQVAGTMGTIKLCGTAGWLFKEADAVTQGWEVYANRQQFHNEEGITLIADATKLAAQGKLKEGIGLPHPPLYYALEDFVKSVAAGAPLACQAAEGLRAAAVGILADQAVRSGATVEIDPSLFEED